MLERPALAQNSIARGGWLAAALAGFAAGLAGGLFGVGGGIVLVPILTALFALSQHQAHGTSLGALAATAVSGVVVYGLAGHVAWLTAALMAVTSVFTARVGARLAARTSRRQLTLAFAALLVIVAARMLWHAPAASIHRPLTGWPGHLVSLVIGAAVGLMAGFLGVGGGLIAVPALTLLFGMSQHTAQGTSLALILVTAPFGAMEHARQGNLVRDLLPGLVVGALVGSPLSSLLAQRLPQSTLARGFAIFLLINALRMTWSALRPPPSARA